MRKNSKVLIIMILLSIPLLLISCSHSTDKKPSASENPLETNEPTFKIDSEDVSSITVYSYEAKRQESADISRREDIETVVNILNSNTIEENPHTLANYRDLEIHMKNGSTLILMLGNGPQISVENTGTFKIETPEDHSKLKQLIERVEKEY